MLTALFSLFLVATPLYAASSHPAVEAGALTQQELDTILKETGRPFLEQLEDLRDSYASQKEILQTIYNFLTQRMRFAIYQYKPDAAIKSGDANCLSFVIIFKVLAEYAGVPGLHFAYVDSDGAGGTHVFLRYKKDIPEINISFGYPEGTFFDKPALPNWKGILETADWKRAHSLLLIWKALVALSPNSVSDPGEVSGFLDWIKTHDPEFYRTDLIQRTRQLLVSRQTAPAA